MQIDPARIEEIFAEAVAISDAAARAGFLDRACNDPTAPRERIEELLAAHHSSASFLQLPDESDAATVAFSGLSEAPGTKIGRYKLLEEIGEGGFGVVFMAEQEEPVRRRVALKIIKAGMDTRQVVARFEAERQALAMMDHPNIARVFDAGATDAGRPYFVMELVKGIPITTYCNQQKLRADARLALFLVVCSAVQHAHQKGIIHRDLKPPNVLVTLHDDRPVPKIIDFGIAKATQARLTEKTLFTEFRQLIGTPAYMSPEQAQVIGLDVDTRSDIYSLGVLLYELLTGTTPFDTKELLRGGYDEMRRIIREVDPPMPSTRLSTLAGGVQETLADQHNSDLKHLRNELRGDLDWIVMKCLEKDRARRYETAGALAADIERHLADEPVAVRRPTRAYRLKKFVRRNKIVVLSSSAIATALVIGLVLACLGLIQARQQAARSAQMTEFLKDVLRTAGESTISRREPELLRGVLDETSRRIEEKLKDEPEVQGDLWLTLGDTFSAAGDHSSAIEMYQCAVNSFRVALGHQSTKLATVLGRLGSSQSFIGNVAAGKANAEAGLQMARNCGEPHALATCLSSVAWSLRPWGQLGQDSAPYLREAFALHQQLGSDPIVLANSMMSLAGVIPETDEALSLKFEALKIHRRHLTPHDRRIADGLQSLGQTLLHAGRAGEAELVLRESLDAYRKIHANDHPHRAIILRFLVQAMAMNAKWDEAESLIQDELQASPESLTNPRYLILQGALAATRGDWSAALVPFSRAVEVTPEDDVDFYNCWFNLVVAHLRLGLKEEYHRHCHQYLAFPMFRGPIESNAAMAALLLPVEGVDFDLACKLVDNSVRTEPNDPWRALAKALADLRRKQFDSAKEWSERVVTADSPPLYRASACYVQAIADAQLQKLESARAAVAKGDRFGDPARLIAIPEFWGSHRWTVADTLRREASHLVGDRPQRSPVASDGATTASQP